MALEHKEQKQGQQLKRSFSLAIMGTRGIPASYGGFETFAEELSKRLVAKGHSVTVFGRRKFFEKHPGPKEYLGVICESSPTIFHKYFETPLAFLSSALSLLGRRKAFDAILLCNAANSPFAWIPRLLGIPVYINVDGIERLRAKWNAFGKLWYILGERCAVLFATQIISDAEVIADYYKKSYGAQSKVIAYGAEATPRSPGQTLAKWKLEPRKYILYVSRLEPENNALGVIQAYKESGVDLPLLIVGDAPYASAYKDALREAAQGSQVLFTGYQFREAYQELQSNCLIYIQATEVGGTHPALIEAMAYGNCIIANGTPENQEVLGKAGEIYEKNKFSELAKILRKLQANEALQQEYRRAARQRAEERYTWEKVLQEYEHLLGLSK